MFSAQSGGSERSGGTRVCPACGTRYAQGTRFCSADGQVLRDDASDTQSLVGSLIAERYYVERQLGVGGMGVVYLARHVYIDRPCALKILRPEFLKNADALGRFSRGAQSASRISHLNVAAVYDFGEIEGESMYLAMEYVDGFTLSDVLESTGKLSVARAATILAQVASALNAAHELGIVHRDLKPDNIMLANTGAAADLVKVVDFGIARAVMGDESQVTSSSAVVGTPAYMSPEQLAGQPVDTRSDTYSLALVAYVMLSGQLPLGTDRVDLAIRFLQRPKRLRELDPRTDWPEELQSVLDRALSTDPQNRHPNVRDFAREFVEAVRVWRPDDAAASVASLARLGADLGTVLPPERIGEFTSTHSTPTRAVHGSNRSRLVFTLSTAGAVAIAGVAYIALRAPVPVTPAPRDTANGRISLPAQRVSPPAPVVDTPVSAAARPRQDPATEGRADSLSPSRRSTIARAVQRPVPAPPTRASAAAPSSGLHDSSPMVLRPPDVIVPIRSSFGFIRIGTPPEFGAALYINDALVGVPRGLRTYSVAPGLTGLRLHIDRCRDWDTTLVVPLGDTATIGTRHPTCSPD